jgi:hypothetical protein
MRVARQAPITLESSSVAASTLDEFDYTGSTTYNTGDEVKVSYESNGTTEKTPVIEYEAIADGITTEYPPDNPTKWSETGTSNRWKMFDDYLNTTTEDTDDIEVSVASVATDLVGLFNLQASSVTFELIRDSVVLKSETINLKIIPGNGWYSWLHDPYDYKTKALWSYTKYTDGTLTVTLSPYAGKVKCGSMIIGSQVYLGQTRYNPRVGIDDYSIITTDSLDRTYLVQGNYADRADITMWLNNTQIDRVRRKLASIRAEACIYDLNNEKSDYDSLRILGYYKNFDITILGPTVSQCVLEIGGIT